MIVATTFYYLLVLYFCLGLIYAGWYMRKRMAQRDEDTLHTSRSIKSVFIPGLILTWPLTFIKWQKPIEGYSNTIQPLLDRHLILWISMAIILPTITILSVLYVPKEFKEKPIRTASLIKNQEKEVLESSDYHFQLRGLAPDSLQLGVILKHVPTRTDDLLIINKKEKWYSVGIIAKKDTQWFALPTGLTPGQIHLAIQDRKTNRLIQQIKL